MKEIDFTLEGIYKESESFCRVREKAMVYLSYSDHTLKSMREKLSENGFESDEINEVLKYLVKRGYINEKAYFERFCNYCALKKGWGRRRIETEAYKKGFAKKTVEDNSEAVFGAIDFDEICREQLIKKKTDFSDKKSRDKAISSLIRLGFTLSQIKEAINNIKEE